MFLDNLYKTNTDHSTRSYDLLQKFGPVVWIVFIVGNVIIMGSVVGVIIIWLLESYMLGTLTPLMEAYLPFVDENTTVGYTIMTSYHLVGAFLGIFGTAACDMLLIMFVVHVKIFVDILNDNIKQLNGALLVKSNRTSREVQMYFRNIVIMHKEIYT